MKNQVYSYCILLLMLCWCSCKQQYIPPQINGTHNYLVVDGYINAGSDSTIFMLSRSVNLNSGNTPPPELGAQLYVQGTNGFSSQLYELGNGRYYTYGLNLDNSQQYRINITTSNGENYLSSFMPLKSSPPIDSISWQRTDSGVNVSVNSHDPSNNTHYYRWDYTETWEYQSTFGSYSHYDPTTSSIIFNNVPVPRNCWISDQATDILIGSSTKLASDLIYMAPVAKVPLNSEKLSVEYSILVRQYAMTLDEYNYWQNLHNNTDLTGGLFDPQPAEFTGNITCTSNPKEPVIGYIGAGTITTSRIFIANSQVFPWYFNTGCEENIVANTADSLSYAVFQGELPIGPYYSGPALIGYYFAPGECVDCTLKGGAPTKPSFWP